VQKKRAAREGGPVAEEKTKGTPYSDQRARRSILFRTVFAGVSYEQQRFGVSVRGPARIVTNRGSADRRKKSTLRSSATTDPAVPRGSASPIRSEVTL
jgi:hypothetical protein